MSTWVASILFPQKFDMHVYSSLSHASQGSLEEKAKLLEKEKDYWIQMEVIIVFLYYCGLFC